MAKVRYLIRNWRQYNQALKERFRLSLRLSDDLVNSWFAEPTARRGAPRVVVAWRAVSQRWKRYGLAAETSN